MWQPRQSSPRDAEGLPTGVPAAAQRQALASTKPARQSGAQYVMAASTHSLARGGVSGVLARARGSVGLTAGVVKGIRIGVAHALHERTLSLRGQGVEVPHDMEEVVVGAVVEIVSTRVSALALLADIHGDRARWGAVGLVVCSARRGAVLLRKKAGRGSSAPLGRTPLRRGRWKGRGLGRRRASRRGGDPKWHWRSDSRGLGRLGEENGDLGLDKGLAISSAGDLWVEGLHAGAEVRPHQEGDVDRALRPPGALCNGLALAALAGEVTSSEGCSRCKPVALLCEAYVDVVQQEELQRCHRCGHGDEKPTGLLKGGRGVSQDQEPLCADRGRLVDGHRVGSVVRGESCYGTSHHPK